MTLKERPEQSKKKQNREHWRKEEVDNGRKKTKNEKENLTTKGFYHSFQYIIKDFST